MFQDSSSVFCGSSFYFLHKSKLIQTKVQINEDINIRESLNHTLSLQTSRPNIIRGKPNCWWMQ